MRRAVDLLKEGTWWLLLGYVLIIPFYRVFSSSLSAFRWTVIFALLVLIVWEVARSGFSNMPLLVPMMAFVGAAVLSLWHSVDPAMSIKYLKKDMFQMVVLFYGCYFLMSERLERIKAMTWTILLSSFFVLATGLARPHFKQGRFSATFQSPTKYGKFLDLVLPLAWAFFWLPVKWWTLPAIILAMGETVALIFSATRSSLLSIPVVVVLQGILAGQKKKLAVTALLLLIITVGAFISGGKRARTALERFKGFSLAVVEKKENLDPSLQTRLLIYKTAWALIKEKPLWGWGYGRHIERTIVKKQGLDWYKKRNLFPFTFHTHSTFLEIWLQCGLIGLLAFLGLLGTFWYKALKGWRKVRRLGEEYFILYLGFLGGLGAFFLHSLITSIFQLRHELLMMVFMASVIALVAKAESEHEEDLSQS